jgi:hypothetical protein
MFMILMDGLAWVVVIGLGLLAFGLISAALGALIGNAIVLLRSVTHSPTDRRIEAD